MHASLIYRQRPQDQDTFVAPYLAAAVHYIAVDCHEHLFLAFLHQSSCSISNSAALTEVPETALTRLVL